jgi:hypothetical protein
LFHAVAEYPNPSAMASSLLKVDVVYDDILYSK